MNVHLATGLATRGPVGDRRVLLVASTYPNHPQALWNLPGGRQRPGELLTATVAREVFEETGLRARIGALAYVSESYDGDIHVLNATFAIDVEGEPAAPGPHDHVVAAAWVPFDEIASRIAVAVVREPLLACLDGQLSHRYAGYERAGITIQWPSDSA